MTIVPMSRLTRADILRLGNNVLPAVLCDSQRQDELGAVNRSLAIHGECVENLAQPSWPRSPNTIAGAVGCIC